MQKAIRNSKRRPLAGFTVTIQRSSFCAMTKLCLLLIFLLYIKEMFLSEVWVMTHMVYQVIPITYHFFHSINIYIGAQKWTRGGRGWLVREKKRVSLFVWYYLLAYLSGCKETWFVMIWIYDHCLFIAIYVNSKHSIPNEIERGTTPTLLLMICYVIMMGWLVM